MAVTTYDVTADEVLETMGYTGEEPEPSRAVITAWITRYAARLNLALSGVGEDPAVTSASNDALYQACRQALIARVAAEWHVANERRSSDYTDRLILGWENFLTDIRRRPAHVGSSGSKPRSHVRSADSGTLMALITDQINQVRPRLFRFRTGFK
jgi:hypothetical protein